MVLTRRRHLEDCLPVQVSLEDRILREPYWLGLMAVFLVMLLIG